MNFCPFCGKELKENMRFCPFCGKTLDKKQHHDAAPQSDPPQAAQHTATLPKSQKKFKKKILIPLLSLFIIVLAVVFVWKPFDGNFSEDPNAIQKASASVVKLTCYDYNNIRYCTGSGFAALDEGIIITNHHVISGDVYSIEVETESGEIYSVDSVVAFDEEKDIAILRVPDCSLTNLKTGKSHNLKKGQKVVSIGSPIGIANTVATGNFSNYLNKGSYVQILSTASTSPGSSGGALFNNRGEVIGITSGVYPSGYDLYYSIPILYVEELYKNSNPEDEMTVAEFYNQSEHPYSIDYVMAYDHILHGQTITVHGYISGFGPDIYLVSSPEQTLNIDTRASFDLAKVMALVQQRNNNYALEVDTTKKPSLMDNLNPGDYIEVVGTLNRYSDEDTRLVATSITKSS